MSKRVVKPPSKVSEESFQTSEATSSKNEPPFRPLVFVSHDSRDAELAETFSNLLTDASGGFLSRFVLRTGKELAAKARNKKP